MCVYIPYCVWWRSEDNLWEFVLPQGHHKGDDLEER